MGPFPLAGEGVGLFPLAGEGMGLFPLAGKGVGLGLDALPNLLLLPVPRVTSFIFFTKKNELNLYVYYFSPKKSPCQ